MVRKNRQNVLCEWSFVIIPAPVRNCCSAVRVSSYYRPTPRIDSAAGCVWKYITLAALIWSDLRVGGKCSNMQFRQVSIVPHHRCSCRIWSTCTHDDVEPVTAIYGQYHRANNIELFSIHYQLADVQYSRFGMEP